VLSNLSPFIKPGAPGRQRPGGRNTLDPRLRGGDCPRWRYRTRTVIPARYSLRATEGLPPRALASGGHSRPVVVPPRRDPRGKLQRESREGQRDSRQGRMFFCYATLSGYLKRASHQG